MSFHTHSPVLFQYTFSANPQVVCFSPHASGPLFAGTVEIHHGGCPPPTEWFGFLPLPGSPFAGKGVAGPSPKNNWNSYLVLWYCNRLFPLLITKRSAYNQIHLKGDL
jgi:hypothetical protein